MSLNEGNQWNVSDGDISPRSWRALDERQAFVAGRAPPLCPSHPWVTGHGAVKQAALTQEAIKNSDLLTHPETLAVAAGRGEEGRGCGGGEGPGARCWWWWWWLFVSRKESENVGMTKLDSERLIFQTLKLRMDKRKQMELMNKTQKSNIWGVG
ncbi:hypothetical protein JOB18_020624 [Solea senegalensis]|uniref:Uncharacterized protein n=1 Tax=Solea senegalensis TaxID=28829 RepID=A0AAV6R7R3_SOLSE|nr:hypothetical protein JOB18_020624 [Solea senegalensis]